jgi:hypothetical protein
MELIIAIPPAAAVPVSIAVGNVQNTGNDANMPMAPTVNAAMDSGTLPVLLPTRKPHAASAAGRARCHTRSCIRSEWRPHTNIARAPQA